jgi:hypothetical protein
MQVTKGLNEYKSLTKYQLIFYSWLGPLKRNVVIVRSKYKGHTLYGFGCDKNMSKAVEKSFLELYPRLSLFDDFADGSRPFINNNLHTLYHWEGKASWTDSFFNKSKLVSVLPKVDSSLKKSDLVISDFELCPELKKIGVKAVHTDCCKMQKLFTGSWTESKINKQAMNASRLPPEVHMIG